MDALNLDCISVHDSNSTHDSQLLMIDDYDNDDRFTAVA